jgi:hypothetical protein
MKLKEIIQEMEGREYTEKLAKKKFACTHCGNTWTELVGLVVAHDEEDKDLCLQIGMEREGCRKCGLQARECQKCGSRDIYEVGFP